MPWVPSHAEMRDHPKTRRGARLAGVPLPLFIGHLHMLWHWALDHAADGDLSGYDAADIAEAVMWEGDPDTLLRALIDCGPADSLGFVDPDLKLHNWERYGGKYRKRQEAGRKAAAVRWQSDGNATASDTAPVDDPEPQPSDQGTDATALGTAQQPQSSANAEERRGEEIRNPSSSQSDPPPGIGAQRTADAAIKVVGQREHDEAMDRGGVIHPSKHLTGCIDNVRVRLGDRALSLAVGHPEWDVATIAAKLSDPPGTPDEHPVIAAGRLKPPPEETTPATEEAVDAAHAAVAEALAAKGIAVPPRRRAS